MFVITSSNYSLEGHYRSSLIQLKNFYLVNISHLKPDQIEASIIGHGESLVSEHFNMGCWAWELGKFPSAWVNSLNYFHVIWCPSRFIQSALSDVSVRPTLYIPPALDIKKSKHFNSVYFKLPENQFTFLFGFDFKSSFARKNPLGCIHAFQNPFPNKNECVGLVIKSIDGDQYSNECKLLIIFR